MPMSFIQALKAIGYLPVPLPGPADEKIVDIAIQRTLKALADRDGDVMLVSHDGDFLEDLEPLVGTDRRVGVIAFAEFRNSGFTHLLEQGLETYDLEYDVRLHRAAAPDPDHPDRGVRPDRVPVGRRHVGRFLLPFTPRDLPPRRVGCQRLPAADLDHLPRPIAWVSTLSVDGVGNLAPHSFFSVAAATPPVVTFTSVGRKDTLANVLATEEFVINVVSTDQLVECNGTSAEVEPSVDEAALLGIAMEPSSVVRPPRVAGSPASIERSMHSTVEVGDSVIVLGLVRAITPFRSGCCARGASTPRSWIRSVGWAAASGGHPRRDPERPPAASGGRAPRLTRHQHLTKGRHAHAGVL